MLPPPLDSRERISDVTSMNQSIPTCAAFVLVLMMKTLIQDVNGCNAHVEGGSMRIVLMKLI